MHQMMRVADQIQPTWEPTFWDVYPTNNCSSNCNSVLNGKGLDNMVGRYADRMCQFLKNNWIMDRNKYPAELFLGTRKRNVFVFNLQTHFYRLSGFSDVSLYEERPLHWMKSC